MDDKQAAVYILSSRPRGTLYVGVTSRLVQRIAEHQSGLTLGFTSRYGVRCLVYFELHADMRQAIEQEKRIKRWRRDWKIALIEKHNPAWRDLGPDILG